jgi:hypothetical protein
MKTTTKLLQKAQLDYLDELKRLIVVTQKLMTYVVQVSKVWIGYQVTDFFGAELHC